MKNNSILITGGTSGIGLTLAKHLYKMGNQIIICGSNPQKLSSLRQEYPEWHILECDLSKEEERIRLYSTIKHQFPHCNMLINNAGIQVRHRIDEIAQHWTQHKKEIAINFEAPIHLSALFTQHFVGKENATIVNVTSGLAFIPVIFAPIYCATKAGAHSFTRTLRFTLKEKNIRVVEVVPPAVKTSLGGDGLHDNGVDVDLFVTSVLERMKNGEDEIGYEASESARLASREELENIFQTYNNTLI